MEGRGRDPDKGTTAVEGAKLDQPNGSTPAPWGTVTGGIVYDDRPGRPGEPMLRWSSRAHSIEEIESELSRIWTIPKLIAVVAGVEDRQVSARTSVMNLVVVARRPEIGERSAAIISQMTGRHPSRTLIVTTTDPDGPSWLDAQIRAYCVAPRSEVPETCGELIYLTIGGESGLHLDAAVAPLLIHDLPVTLWWPGEPPFHQPQAMDLIAMADRLVVDGSAWRGSGLTRLREMAGLLDRYRLAISDFALARQSRWREAIASVFDLPDLLPYLRYIRRISVTYGTHEEEGSPEDTNVVKPVYHVSWLASRLGMIVEKPLAPVVGPRRPGGKAGPFKGFAGSLRHARGETAVIIRPVMSAMPTGTTLRVEILAERRGSELRTDVTAEAHAVHVRVWQDGVELVSRTFAAPRRTDVDLLAEAIEAGPRERVSVEAIHAAAALAGHVEGVGGHS